MPNFMEASSSSQRAPAAAVVPGQGMRASGGGVKRGGKFKKTQLLAEMVLLGKMEEAREYAHTLYEADK